MATFTHRTVKSTRHEWVVPTAEPWGAPAEEINKAWVVAANAYREANGLPDDTTLPGDALTFHVTDDAIVIRFTTEETQR